MNTDVMGSNQFKRRWAAPKDNYEPFSPPDAEAEAAPFAERPVAESWKKKTPEELDPPMEPGIKEAIDAMKKHEKEDETKSREDKLKAIDEVNKDDADVYEKRVEIVKKKHEKKAKARTEAAAKGKVLPPDSESSDEDDLVHPVKAGETVMDRIAPVPKEDKKPASLAQGGFLVTTPLHPAPVAKAKAPAPAKAVAKPAVAQTAAKAVQGAHEEKHEGLSVEGGKHDCEFDAKSESPLASCRSGKAPKPDFKPYVGAAEVKAKTADDRAVKGSRLRDLRKESLEEYEKMVKEWRAKEATLRKEKLAKMKPEEKAAFLKEEAHHVEEMPTGADAATAAMLWVPGHAHDCVADLNSDSPLASCRGNKPPKDNYQPYVGAADIAGPAKAEDTREVTHSRIHNIY